MPAHRTQRATRGLVVLAVLLGSLWAGTLAAGAGNPADQLSASRARLGLEVAILPDSAPALRPSTGRPDPGGRLPLCLLVAALAATLALRPRRLRSDPAPGRVAGPATRLQARAPPRLQPA
jgi:hypothetical protein